jgi:hypothetical protein
MPYFELGEGGEITWSDRAGPGVLTNLDLKPAQRTVVAFSVLFKLVRIPGRLADSDQMTLPVLLQSVQITLLLHTITR